ncbi:GFA family protein [Motiliproteus coralliicola]|uniref:GFA family protein n=1 Tax=Motiliproteus coralliicola TaxID=2283196 RepID=A0A369WSU8_9GAMM|nr:GFA family protein [Motiliproteus coralliicola]RDE24762.1 GFA family protein [Motiliproteus coralliicola]
MGEVKVQQYQGRCHCGAVSFSFTGDPIEQGLRCNCSLCARKGALMLPYLLSREQLKIEANPDSLGLYQFGSRVAKHYFCRHCGIYTFHETLRTPGSLRVNLGCIEELDLETLAIQRFDGKHLL